MTHRHLRAFVSSRMQELAEERDAVREALKALYVNAFVYEADAGARPDSARSTYLSEIDDSDLYIGLFWTGYGAYTIEEYEHARRLRRPCLIYEKRTGVAAARTPELQSFLDRISAVETGHTIAWFDTAEELRTLVASDVARWLASVVRGAGRGGVPFQAPPLSDRHVPRPELIAELRARLLPERVGGRPRARVAVLHGLGGSGKTSLARELAHDAAVLGALPHGVLWVSLGQHPDLRQRLADWGRALGEGEVGMVGYPDVETGTARLRALLLERACLLIVDDAWDADHVKAFDAGGPDCLLVVTTRQGTIAAELHAERIAVPPMDEAVALRVLAKRAGEIAAADLASAKRIASDVGHLPLALDLIAAQVSRLGSWTMLLEAWRERGPRLLVRSRGAAGREDNLLDSIELSIGALPAEDRSRFFQLGVFDEDTPFPASPAAALWDLSAFDASDLLADLVDRALLREERDAGASSFSLHDLLHDVTRDQLGDGGLASAHALLLDGYRRRCAEGWPSCADDGYLHGHLAGHLIGAGRRDELYALIDEPWLRAQFRRSYAHRDFARDVERMIEAASAEQPARLAEEVRGSVIYATLGSLARHVPPAMLALLVRLGQIERATGMASMLADARERVDALLAIAGALERTGDEERARAVAADAIDASHGVPDGTLEQERRRDVLARLAPPAARAGRLPQWRAVVDTTGGAMMPVHGAAARRRVLADSAAALAEAGFAVEAEAIVTELTAGDGDATDAVAPLCSLAWSAASPAAARDFADRALALAAAQDAGRGRDSDLLVCAHTLFGLGREADALQTIDGLATSWYRTHGHAAAARSAATDRPQVAAEHAARSLAAVRALVAEGDPADAAHALSETFDAHLLAGDAALSAAVTVALELEASPLGFLAVSAAARALASAGRHAEGLALAQRLDPQYRHGAIGAIAAGLALDGDFAGSAGLIDTIPRHYRGPALVQLGLAQLGAGRVDEALATLWDPALSTGHRVQALTQVAEAMLERGQRAETADVLAATLASCEVAGDLGGVAELLSAMAEALNEHGRSEQAHALAMSAASFARRAGDFERVGASLSSGLALIGCGDAAAAAELIDALPAPAERLFPTLVCAGRLARDGHVDESRRWAERSTALVAGAASDAERRRAASWLAELRARLGDHAAAREALAGAEAGLDALPAWSRFDVLAEVAVPAARLGDHTRALDLLRAADALIEQETNQLMTVSARRATVVQRLLSIERHEEALALAREIPMERARAETLTAVAASRSKKDPQHARMLLDEAVALIRSKTFGHERALALAGAATALHELGMAEGVAAAREAATLAESASVDAVIRSELRRIVARALHDCGARTEALALWRADLAASRTAGRARTLLGVAAGVPLLADVDDGATLERTAAGLIAAEAWWSGVPTAEPTAAVGAV
jgi:tetratricopeptide (TPR) repeat protein